MVGGRVIEARRMRTESGRDVVRLWCVETRTGNSTPDECAVYSEPYEDGAGPKVGDSIWWQGGKIMFDGDRRTVRKVGFSFDPRRT
jgi:hypothetical protein